MKREIQEQTYEWHFLTRFPPTYLDAPRFVSMLREFIKESADAHIGFGKKLRETAMVAITDSDPEVIRQALQCLAHVGALEDVPALNALEQHANPLVQRDVKTCIFEIQKTSKPSD